MNELELRKARFWARVAIPDGPGCWLWQGLKTPQGYGSVRISGSYRPHGAHRVAYTYAVGAIPRGEVVMHKCDNPGCVNPEHLLTGTQKENLADMTRKGRRVARGTPGQNNPGAKLTDAETMAIFRSVMFLGHKRQHVANCFGISKAAVSRICQGRHSLTRGLV